MATKGDLNIFRHKWENRMVGVAVLFAILATIILIALIANHQSAPEWLKAMVLTAYVTPIIISIFIRYNYWKEVTQAVEVTNKQYPEIYKIFRELVKKGDFVFMPKLYVKNGNGTLNAFASKYKLDITKGAYVVVYSDIVDSFYDLGNKDTLRFVLAHELGHIKLGHVNVRRSVMQGILKPIFLQATFSRAQEYSADRFGASITNKIAMPSLSILAAGKRNYERLNVESYINNDTKKFNRFWMAVVNFQSNHAVLRRRLAAARQMDKQGWQNVHGKML